MGYKIKKAIKKFISLNYIYFILYKIYKFFIYYLLSYCFVYLSLVLLSLIFNYKPIIFHFINYFIISLFPIFIIFPLLTSNNKKFIYIIDYKNILYSYLYLNELEKRNENDKNDIKKKLDLLLNIFYKKSLYKLRLSKNSFKKIKFKFSKSLIFLILLNLIFLIIIEIISYKKFDSFFFSYVSENKKKILNIEKFISQKENLYKFPVLKDNEKQLLLSEISKIRSNIKNNKFNNEVELLETLNKLERKLKNGDIDNQNKSKIIKQQNEKTLNENKSNNSFNKLLENSFLNENDKNQNKSEIKKNFPISFSQNQKGFKKIDQKILIESPIKKYKTFLDIIYSEKKGNNIKTLNIYSNKVKLNIIDTLFNDFIINTDNNNIIDEDIIKLYDLYKNKKIIK